jgi:prefoldin subunit 5
LSPETLKSYIETLHEGIEDYKDNLKKEQEKKREITELLLRAQTEIVVNAIKDEIESIDESIADWQDEIDDWSSVETKLVFILEILNENIENWDLEYTNG